jgi:endonuclease-3
MITPQRIQKILDEHFPHPDIPLCHTSPYTLLIAVLLSARCTDAMVNRITPHLFKMADTPEKMVQLTIPEIQAIIRPCGLSPTKAKAIWHLSKILIEQHEGQVPQDFTLLEALPGIGHKSASVVMAQMFNVPAFPVDTHIHRCAKRWGLSSGKNRNVTERDLKKLFPKKSWIKLHLQIIYFARKYCFARGHKTEQCPICNLIDNN